jgi:hypothetical protein
VTLKIKEKLFKIYNRYTQNKISSDLSTKSKHKAAIIYTYEDNNKNYIVNEFVNLLKTNNYQVKVSCYIESIPKLPLPYHSEHSEQIEATHKEQIKNKSIGLLKDEQQNTDIPYKTFKHDSISIFGKIKDKELSEFVNEEFSHIYVFDLEINPIIKLLTTRTKAKYKVGNHTNNNTQTLNVLIKLNDSTNYQILCNNMIHYSKLLK